MLHQFQYIRQPSLTPAELQGWFRVAHANLLNCPESLGEVGVPCLPNPVAEEIVLYCQWKTIPLVVPINTVLAGLDFPGDLLADKISIWMQLPIPPVKYHLIKVIPWISLQDFSWNNLLWNGITAGSSVSTMPSNYFSTLT